MPPSPPAPQVVVAESYGGRDEPLDSLTAGFVAAGVEPLLDLRVKEEPSEAVYQVGRQGGRWSEGAGVNGTRKMQVAGVTCPTHPPQ